MTHFHQWHSLIYKVNTHSNIIPSSDIIINYYCPQLNAFRSLMSSDYDPKTNKYIPLVNNFRPPMKVNNRKVQANFIISDGSKITARITLVLVTVAAALQRLLLWLWFLERHMSLFKMMVRGMTVCVWWFWTVCCRCSQNVSTNVCVIIVC